MNTFDRYILRSFARNYLLSFVVLVGLYIVLDMVLNLDEFRNSQAAGDAAGRGGLLSLVSLVGNIADFYFFQSFVYFVQLSGVIPVAAAAFTLFRMTRSNELTAMLAAGVPMLRLAAPIMVAGVIANGLLVVDQELFIPQMVQKLMRNRDEVSSSQRSVFQIRAMEDQNDSLLLVARYTPESADGKQPASMEKLDIIERDKTYQPIAYIQAPRAWYDDKTKPQVWRLQDGVRLTGLRGNEPLTQASIDVWHTSITPAEIAIYRRHDVAEYLTSSQINDLLLRPRNYGTVPLLRVRNWRLAQPLANVVLLLLAIPCVLTRDPAGLKWSATRTLLLTGACLCSTFVAHQLAGTAPLIGPAHIWTPLILWTPIFIFGPVAVVLLDRVKT